MSDFFTLTSQLSTAVDQLNQILQGDENATVTIDGEEKPSVQKKILDEVLARVQLVLDAAADIDAVKYANTAAGIAATTDGQFFSVVSSNDDSYLELYENAAGVAELRKTYPSENAVLNIAQQVADFNQESNAGLEQLSREFKHSIDALDINYDKDESLLIFTDQRGNIVFSVDTKGQLNLTGLNHPVQKVIAGLLSDVDKIPKQQHDNNVLIVTDNKDKVVAKLSSQGELTLSKKSSINENYDDDIFVLIDKNDNVSLRVDKNSQLHIPGLEHSIQESIKILQTVKPYEYSLPKISQNRTKRDRLSQVSLNTLLTQKLSTNEVSAPYAMPTLPHDYTVPNDIINNFSLVQPSPRQIDTPYFTNDQVVHPSIVEFYDGFRGYKYWLALTPYKDTNDVYENPCIYGSNDLINFELLDGFEQPLANKPDESSGHLSDVGLTYDPKTGELICFWRKTIKSPASKSSLWCRRTKDGVFWTDAEIIHPEVGYSTNAYLSPSFVFDPVNDIWHMFNCQDAGAILHKTSPSFYGPWTAQPHIYPPAGQKVWHLDCRYIGDKMVMIIHDYLGTKNLYLGISDDNGETWTLSETLLLSGDFLEPYKATFLPEFNEKNELALRVIWTSSSQPANPEDHWLLFSNTTNFVNI